MYRVRKFSKLIFQKQVSNFLSHNVANSKKRGCGPGVYIHYIRKVSKYDVYTHVSETVQAFDCGDRGFIEFISPWSLIRSKASVVFYAGNSCFLLFYGFDFFFAKLYKLAVYSKRKRFFSCDKAYAQSFSFNILACNKFFVVLKLCDKVCCLCTAAEPGLCNILFAFFSLFCDSQGL